ncbi:hypothetical protein BJ912DRAFT_984402 [Pholiota molesta]|nr:hypothetical protein BJ912DRAFT_984402 [Pholiota molesta]
MAEPTHPEVKYKRSKKIEEVGLLRVDLSGKLDEVSKDEVKDARTFGVEKLEPYNGKISEMEKSLEFMRYYSTLPRKPSTAEVQTLKDHIQKNHKIYLTQSQQMAEKAKLEEERVVQNAKLADQAAYYMGRKIKERYTPSPAFDDGSSRGGPSPSPSEFSMMESLYMREPTPQPVPAPLPAPPRMNRFGGSTSRDTTGPHGMHTERVASSSRYMPPGRNPTLEYQRHRYINSIGLPKNFLEFEDGVSEKSTVILEEQEHRSL